MSAAAHNTVAQIAETFGVSRKPSTVTSNRPTTQTHTRHRRISLSTKLLCGAGQLQDSGPFPGIFLAQINWRVSSTLGSTHAKMLTMGGRGRPRLQYRTTRMWFSVHPNVQKLLEDMAGHKSRRNAYLTELVAAAAGKKVEDLLVPDDQEATHESA